MGCVFKLKNSEPPKKGDWKWSRVKVIRGGQGLEAAELWKQLDLNPVWPVFVSAVVYRKSCIEIERLSLSYELRVLANGMSQRSTVQGAGKDVGRTFWRDVHSL